MEQFFDGLTHLMPWILGAIGIYMLPGPIISFIVTFLFVSFLLISAVQAWKN